MEYTAAEKALQKLRSMLEELLRLSGVEGDGRVAACSRELQVSPGYRSSPATDKIEEGSEMAGQNRSVLACNQARGKHNKVPVDCFKFKQ